MSNLKSKIEQLSVPKRPETIVSWFSSLSPEDQEIAWAAMTNENLKSYTLFKIFREEGLRCAKDTFIPLRKEILSGAIKRADINE